MTETLTTPPYHSPTATTLLPVETVLALRRFRHENSPHHTRGPAPVLDGPVASKDELCDLLLFAAARIGNGDPGVPRQLEAFRVISLVPEETGADLFAGYQPRRERS